MWKPSKDEIDRWAQHATQLKERENDIARNICRQVEDVSGDAAIRTG